MTCAGCGRPIHADEARVLISFAIPGRRTTHPLNAHARCFRLEPTPAAARKATTVAVQA